PKCDGQILLTQLWKRLNLVECDYFGLEFQNTQSYWIWLEPMKPIIRQIRRPKNVVLRLAVKFFPPDPGQLQEEYTRYLFALQLKRDLLEERLTCADTTAALLTSHLLQSEIGDYDEMLDREHLKANEYLPGQQHCLEKILEFHRKHVGQTPAESDFQVLEVARKLEMYGIRFHMASDREGTKIQLAVSHMGVLVFQGPYQDTLEFLLGSRDECKNFWKICVEYHTFFRLLDQPKPKAKAVFFSRGSSFRYSGRTQKQLVDYFKDSGMKRIPYERLTATLVLLQGPKALGPLSLAKGILGSDPQPSVTCSVLFPEGLRTPASPSSANASFYSLAPSTLVPPGLPEFKDSSSSLTEPQVSYVKSPAAERSSGAVAGGPDTPSAQPVGPPALQPGPGLSTKSPQPSPSSRKSPLSLSPAFQVPLGPAEQGSSPLLSPVLSDAGGSGMDYEEPRHKWFRSAVVKEDAMPATLMTLLFSNIDPIYEFHRGFLREVEQRLALWEGPSKAHTKGGHQRIGDILLRNMLQLKEFTSYFQRHDEVLTELEKATKRFKKLEAVYKEFELQKVCYLPLNTFLLKPIQRLLHYRLLLRRLCGHYTPGHHDYADCHDALKAITEVTTTLQHILIRLENLQKLTELQRDLVGVENLIAPGREFIREGCLHKLTKKGLQQRMFFLFSDMLLYTSKGVAGTSHFRIRGLLPLRGMLVEESENEWSVPHCFTIYAAQKTIVVAASTRLEKEKWMLDLNNAIQAAKSGGDTAPALPGSTVCTRPPRSPNEVSLEQESEDDARGARSSLEGHGQHRANTTMHVCWYRNTSVSRADHSAAVENQLSGYLLRKFKNNHGWQKLWVVFTNFCLFFYKTHQDDYPLASLPLLGYSVSIPQEADGIHKDYVFKLQFKSHVYFFRAESKYTFERWMEVIQGASSSAGRAPSIVQDGPQPSSGLEGMVRGKEE
ncbi:hypothetical protein H8959_012884, partial [Pygathrix nigripes]